MNNLAKIREKITDVKNILASLKVDPGKLDDLDNVSNQRAILREKIGVLEEAEAAERERLAEEEKKNNGKRRRAALVELAETTEKLMTEYDSLTDQAQCLVNELVGVLISREHVFTTENAGLDKPIYRELFTSEEHENLLYEMRRSTLEIYANEFTATFYRAVDNKASGDSMQRVALLIKNLVKPPSRESSAIKGASDNLLKLAKSLQFKGVPEPVSEENVQPEPVAQKSGYEFDPRTL